MLTAFWSVMSDRSTGAPDANQRVWSLKEKRYEDTDDSSD
jgi:hypothetical protein